MRKLRTLSWTVAVFGTFVSGAVSAQTLGPTEPEVVSSSLGETSALRLGLTLAPMPLGTVKSNNDTSVDLGFAFALAPVVDYSINQFLFVGFAPQYIFNIKDKEAKAGDPNEAGSELDIRVRVGGNAKVADSVMLYGYLAPGYSFLMPKGLPDGVDNPKGFVLGFAGGAMMDLTPALFLSGEIGYQVGYQATEFAGVSVDSKTNFMHIGVGLGFRI